MTSHVCNNDTCEDELQCNRQD